MKTTFKKADTSPLSWNEGGRPTSKDIVKHHKMYHVKDLGYSNFTTDRPGKQSVTGKGQGKV